MLTTHDCVSGTAVRRSQIWPQFPSVQKKHTLLAVKCCHFVLLTWPEPSRGRILTKWKGNKFRHSSWDADRGRRSEHFKLLLCLRENSSSSLSVLGALHLHLFLLYVIWFKKQLLSLSGGKKKTRFLKKTINHRNSVVKKLVNLHDKDMEIHSGLKFPSRRQIKTGFSSKERDFF